MTDANEIFWCLTGPLETAAQRAVERMARLDDVERVAVMPDAHLAGGLCVGTAVATRRLLYPALIGGDIGCGMSAGAFDVEATALDDGAAAGLILRRLSERVPIRRRNRRFAEPWPDELRFNDLSSAALGGAVADEARLQLGTLGGGNHFLELQADGAGQLWLMLHTGSRNVGQEVRAHHAQGRPMPALDVADGSGQAYLNDASWATRYAAANRRAIARQVVDVLHEAIGANEVVGTWIDCDHNHLTVEPRSDANGGGSSLHVHRKGAMRAEAGLVGVLPGSMGARSYHVVGKGNDAALRSSAHGAGRRMSRAAARERFTTADVRQQLADVWFDPRHEQGLREELPGAYKDVCAVLRASDALVDATRTLHPVLIYKGA